MHLRVCVCLVRVVNDGFGTVHSAGDIDQQPETEYGHLHFHLENPLWERKTGENGRLVACNSVKQMTRLRLSLNVWPL